MKIVLVGLVLGLIQGQRLRTTTTTTTTPTPPPPPPGVSLSTMKEVDSNKNSSLSAVSMEKSPVSIVSANSSVSPLAWFKWVYCNGEWRQVKKWNKKYEIKH